MSVGRSVILLDSENGAFQDKDMIRFEIYLVERDGKGN